MPADSVNPSGEMTFLEHLEEFRRRVIVSLITVGFFMLISLSFGKPIERILRLPLDLSTNALLASLIEKINGSSASFFGFLAITLRASASSVNATLMKLSPLNLEVEAELDFLQVLNGLLHQKKLDLDHII